MGRWMLEKLIEFNLVCFLNVGVIAINGVKIPSLVQPKNLIHFDLFVAEKKKSVVQLHKFSFTYQNNVISLR